MLTEEQKKQIELQNQRITENLSTIKHKIVVFSGKGGVGKTTVSVNLASALQQSGKAVGVLDADVTGPNVPKMLGIRDDRPILSNYITPIRTNGLKCISLANLISPKQAVVWRGPMRSKLISQFLGDVDWGKLDFLIADLPPGTGDEIVTITQQMNPDMAIIVTTPQEVSLIDSVRAINMAKDIKIPKIGLVENMSGLACPDCGKLIDLFGSGGGEKQAKKMNIPFLGTLPIDIDARKLADDGKPIILANKKADISQKFLNISNKVLQMLENEPEEKNNIKSKEQKEEVV